MDIGVLPRVDEHATVVAATAVEVWDALGASLERSFGRPARPGTHVSSASPTVGRRGRGHSSRGRSCPALP